MWITFHPVEQEISIKFSRDQALVLSEWLNEMLGTKRFDGLINGSDRAVWSPIHKISATLDHVLPEMFMSDYTERLAAARERLLGRPGTNS